MNSRYMLLDDMRRDLGEGNNPWSHITYSSGYLESIEETFNEYAILKVNYKYTDELSGDLVRESAYLTGKMRMKFLELNVPFGSHLKMSMGFVDKSSHTIHPFDNYEYQCLYNFVRGYEKNEGMESYTKLHKIPTEMIIDCASESTLLIDKFYHKTFTTCSMLHQTLCKNNIITMMYGSQSLMFSKYDKSYIL